MQKYIKILTAIVILLSCIACQKTNPDTTALSTGERIKCELLRVVDGDTITVIYNSNEEKVRLIGVDAPESVNPDDSKNNSFGEMASEYTKELLNDIKYVYLEFDTAQYDSYGRLLAYVYLTNSSNFTNSLNYVLVEDGYAINKAYPPNEKYAGNLEDARKSAQKESCGLWQEKNIEQIWNE